ncbi:hypothetical protein [Actinophytocola glycyrrhizae]|uniref:Uncharacterized protein n=1 Tax=Actinophytocola glycyrrhizae TaxID=2044873 RepID=A0ABV9SCM0_9PSEU
MLGPTGTTNPTPEEIMELVRQVRASGDSSRARAIGAEANKAGADRAESDKKEVADFFDTYQNNTGGYAGFFPDHDSTVMGIMSEVGCQPGPTDIIVVPADVGMGLSSGANPAVALMTEDKVALFRKIAVTNYGPGKVEDGEPNPDYQALVARFTIGTIVIAKSLMSQEFKLKGTIWHECGHKLRGIKEEAGLVFVSEISAMRDAFGKEAAYEWALKLGRTADYHRTYGLAKDPGRKELLLLLQEICPEHVFYDEFRKQYEDIMGEPLKLSDDLGQRLRKEKEERDAARRPVEVGTVLTGTLPELCAQVPEQDVAGALGVIRPAGAKLGDTVTFAGKKWVVRGLGSRAGKTLYTLECTVTELPTTVVKKEEVWEKTVGPAKSYGLAEAGPWSYTRYIDAMNDSRVVEAVIAKVLEMYPQMSRETLYPLVRDEVTRTVKQ